MPSDHSQHALSHNGGGSRCHCDEHGGEKCTTIPTALKEEINEERCDKA